MSAPRPGDRRDPLATVLAQLEEDRSRNSADLFADIVARYFNTSGEGVAPVSTTSSAAELQARFDEALPPSGRSLAEVAERLEQEVVPDSNWLSHPMYMGHQVSAPLPAAVWTESLTAAINNSLAVWEMSPVGTALENTVIRCLSALAGYGDGSGGTLTSGGTEATFTALLAARARLRPDAWTRGLSEPVPALVSGEHAHYAVSRAAGMMGLGVDNVIAVPSKDFAMDVGALRATIERLAGEGRDVLAVVATAGSTATGSFDDLEAIADACARAGSWLHVDGAHGASALLSERHRHRVAGIDRADSIAWDPHKMMLLPLSAGVVLVRNEGELERAFAQSAPYLFHGSAAERTWDQGVRSFQCSRRADVLKLWVALQRYGADGIAALYDYLCNLAAELHRTLAARDDFEVMHSPSCNILCFRYTGGVASDAENLDRVNRELRERYNRSGKGWITTTVLNGRRVLRVTMMNPRTRTEHVDALVSGLSELGRSLLSGD